MRFKPAYMVLALFLVFALLSYYTVLFDDVENYMKDNYFQSSKAPDTQIVIIGIDNASLEVLGSWPWPRSVHAELLNIISQSKPAAVGVDIFFMEPSDDPQADAALAEALRSAGNVILPCYGVFSGENAAKGQVLKPEALEMPLEALLEAAEVGHINVMADWDGIFRRSIVHFDYEGKSIDSFSKKIYETYRKSMGKPADNYQIPVDPWGRAYIDFIGQPGEFEKISYVDVLSGTFPADYFKDKIVLIGPAAEGMGDFFYTPLSRKSPMFGVEVHANMIQNLMYRSFKKEASYPVNLAVLIAFCIIAITSFRKLHPLLSALITAASVILYFYAVKYTYARGYMLTLVYPVAFILLAYFIMLAYRYIEALREKKRITGIFGRYVAPQIVNEILKKGEGALKLGGSRQEITALFVDIRGFTPLSEKVEPEEIVSILNEYLNLCATAIFQYGGTLDKFIGDATMAIFNAPVALDDHVFRAVQTAWAMKEGSVVLRQKLEERYGKSVQFGIGINTGPAVVGNIGSKSRMDYTAIGDTVNTAARLESNAKAGQILLSESVYEQVKDRVLVKDLGQIQVKGKTQGISIYELEGLK